jgi:23S rRNA pseudouridine1911/1915/1917 synthase
MNKISMIYKGGGVRLDKFLANPFSNFSRSQIQKSITDGEITVNGSSVDPDYKLKENDRIAGELVEVKPAILIPQKIKLDIIFENDDVLVINKPAGLVIHPGDNKESDTLANSLLDRYPEIIKAVPDRGDEDIKFLRPGIVHRLDKDTSGAMIIAKNKKSYDFLKDEFDKREVNKIYLALCFGSPKQSRGVLTNFLGRIKSNRKMMGEVGEFSGKKAITNYKVLSEYKYDNIILSLIEFDIKTGRTHQIRAQAKLAGFPIIGDQMYFTRASKVLSGKLNVSRQLLHSHTLTIKLPGENKSQSFEAELPLDLQSILSDISALNQL